MQSLRNLPAGCVVLFAAIVLVQCTTPVDYAVAGPDPDAAVEAWITTPDRSRLLERQSWRVTRAEGPHDLVIDVDPSDRYQQITGFGAALTGSSAWLIQHHLTPDARALLLLRLFDPEFGAGLSLLRLPIGATDFSLSSYTYNDVPEGEQDWALERFSIHHDRAEILPVLKEIQQVATDMRFIAAPWSAPAWMKTNGSLHGGRLRDEAFEVYAAYLRRFVEAYAAEGVDTYALTMINEPHHEAGYPSMRMDVSDRQRFVGQHLGPALHGAGLGTRILLWDHNWSEVNSPIEVLRDPDIARYVSGVAFHCYAGDVAAQSVMKNAFPELDIYFTECSGGGWAPDFGSNLQWNVRNLVIGATRHWSKSVLLWNLALDPAGGPKNGGCQDCRGVVTIDPSSGRVAYNEEYYALAHVARFVRPGAWRIASDTFRGDVESVAFRNPDGSTVLVVLNETSDLRRILVSSPLTAFRFTLEPGAVATFRWRD
jgi:glucosylceramidase